MAEYFPTVRELSDNDINKIMDALKMCVAHETLHGSPLSKLPRGFKILERDWLALRINLDADIPLIGEIHH